MEWFLAGLLVGWVLRGRQTPHARRKLPAATAIVAQAMAGNKEAIALVDEQRTLAAGGDIEAIGYVADLGAAWMMAEVQKRTVDTTVETTVVLEGDAQKAAA